MSIKIKLPQENEWEIKYIVFDMNGTLSCDGIIPIKVKEKLQLLAQNADLYLLTADTFGTAAEQAKDMNIKLHKLMPDKSGTKQKAEFIKKLGAENCIAVGNGANDRAMLEEAKIGIAVLGNEGTSIKTLMKADFVVKDIIDALDCMLNPKRIIATLRTY